jgi:hypothetical protein
LYEHRLKYFLHKKEGINWRKKQQKKTGVRRCFYERTMRTG